MKRSRKPRRSVARLANLSIFGIAVAVAVGLILCWNLLYRLFGDGISLLGLVNAGGHLWGMLAIVCAAVAALRRAWITAGVAVLAVFLILAQVHLPLPSAGSSPDRMRVVTASLRTANTDMADAARDLAALSPDILVVQEASDPAAFQAAFVQARPGWHGVRLQNRLILSRWPAVLARGDREIFRATVTTPAGPLSVWNVRAPKDYRGVIENRRYFLALSQDIVDVGGAGIAAGDYNASPWNEGYAAIDALMDDGYRRTRWMPGFTFPGPARRSGVFGPFVSIDHVFATKGIRPLTAFTAPASAGADHLPVVVDFALPGR